MAVQPWWPHWMPASPWRLLPFEQGRLTPSPTATVRLRSNQRSSRCCVCADLLEFEGAIPDSPRYLDHLKLLYHATLRREMLPGPSWPTEGGGRQREITGAHRELVAHIQQLHARVATWDGCNMDYYASSMCGAAARDRRWCTRS
ncbi:hypothetical protein ZWY2020_011086 [Hordeum vulgare]|nr:hypothetical protein ZWY2020_011086 [Hordeum vulgare]